jgi:hypothetical protein
MSRDRYPASSLARWLLPSNELQNSCNKNTAPSIVACSNMFTFYADITAKYYVALLDKLKQQLVSKR